jgi:adenylate kinase
MGFKLRQFGELDHPLSPTVKADLTAGRLVSLETIATILKHYQSTHTGGSIVFDGIPRNAEQKHMFDTIFPEHIIIFLNLNKDIAIERLAGRKIDPETGESFPASFDGQFSPYTGHRLIKRADDTPAIVEKRIDTFYQNTLPLLAHWAESGKRVYTVDAS